MSESSDSTKLNVNLEVWEADLSIVPGATNVVASDEVVNEDHFEGTHESKADSVESPEYKSNAASVEDMLDQAANLPEPLGLASTSRRSRQCQFADNHLSDTGGRVDQTTSGMPMQTPPKPTNTSSVDLEEIHLPKPPGFDCAYKGYHPPDSLLSDIPRGRVHNTTSGYSKPAPVKPPPPPEAEPSNTG
ncbi:hypothetical protein B0H10DRAFT_1945426 [Mycena sp. CBHHK59/15]|nr:hypothetical protein B0H10DRAFT_1945426 [Mycena sp. CBHHK59/15]